MKIAILTYHAPCNFGANLQAFSFVSYFESLGHEVKVLNFIREKDEQYYYSVNAKQYKAHSHFSQEVLPVTRRIQNKSDLLKTVREEKFDLVSIGADAVWRAPKSEDDFVFFADWLFDSDCHVPAVVLSAAHMGDGFMHLRQEHREKLKNCVSKFSFIAVRDRWTQEKVNRDLMKCEYVTHINPDPVIWLEHLIDTSKPLCSSQLNRPYYLMSLPTRCSSAPSMRRWFKSFKELVNNKGYILVELPLPEGISGFDFDYSIPYPIDPLDWFAYLHNAKAFCGLRFHAIMSCLSSGTPFFSIDSYGKTGIFLSLLRKLKFYRITRAFDSKSKIRNLLKGSGFEHYRVSGSISMISAKKIFNMLEAVDSSKVLSYRDLLRKDFADNVSEMFETIKNNEN